MQAINNAFPQSATALKPKTGNQGPSRKRRFPLGSMLKNKEIQTAAGSGILMLTAWGVSHWSEWLSIVLYVLSYTLGGWTKAREGMETLVKERDLDVNLLMIAASLGAAAIGYWNEGAMLIFIFALSGALESYTNERSSKDISELMALKPETALRLNGTHMEKVNIEELVPGDLLIVKPGELIPADGCVTRGYSAVNQASITGESVPVDKTAGDEVYAGTLNGEGVLYVEVTKNTEETLFAKMIRLVEEAQTVVPDSQRFIKRFESMYARIVVVVTLLLIAGAPLLLGWGWEQAFYKAMVFLVVASPCALVSSIMPAVLSTISNRARKGILFKGGAHVENMALASVVAFDKTGTLTVGSPLITDWVTAEGIDADEMLSAVAAIEGFSMHPLARAVVSKAAERGLVLPEASNVQSLTGWGMEGEVDGVRWKIGRTDILDREETAAQWRELRNQFEKEGKTVSVILQEGQVAGLLAMRDELRPQAPEAVQRLRSMGIKVVMLTGDRRETASVIAAKAGVDQVYAGLTPEDKVNHVRDLRERYGHVVMIGDGVNDAPALGAATVGLGMGMNGSGAALEVADVVLMNDSIEEIAPTIALARRTQRIIKQNMIFAITVILLLIAGNFLENIALPLGVVGHEGSTLLVILNGLRLLRS
ncbi:heavy metal translocating P-type ATPase [Paenibacillus sp. P96]|uniref:Heavy metal translocating P-type ATPase n=1 Tax=Paenibacillus zeirhizosphaerae TaxID=2987519 RepID=A0ABT9FTI0_9BACL|nr:heavy metal translocating P-type ATPase [Paenibacillus sp. P96]MDP4098039.1 heavy metal translocating P-type ATPase [Paenibacillus sp. P96]